MKITIENLSMVYPNGKTALDQISCTLESPNLIGLLGPNGAGKSTLMKLLTAALVPTSGRILVDGEPLLKHEQQLKQQLGYLPQAFGLYDELTIWQFLDYMAALKQINQPAKAIEQAIWDTNLNAKRKSRISSLSGGERQRVGIAQAMLDDPQFLILDEPTVGLDPKERLDFRNLFSKKAQDHLVLLSTHIIDDVQSVCNQLIVIDHGRILFIGTPAQLIASARGHVALFNDQPVSDKIHITARINTAEGIQCRGVAENMPADSMLVEPTLEDAYMYLIQYKGA
ncbi:ATP-binding cassette domain-containing protein [Dielma fastidiosa]|uniref:ABC-type multidrug transport system ATPase subunit n=1 Tax=Dielma fastidiosa TaxID=1034346 RepID=A0A318KQQ6_9FIRM|nr:ATP-binding cassette domain-containing protein [Dielma fastidiosa]PXX80151.1 ABC-type multidrug transport system ATPase subunit [Dielma fastidiosa]